MQVKSTVKINISKIKQLTQAATKALELTAEDLHTDVVQAQVIPRMDGALQGEKFFVDYSESDNGKVSLAHEGPYSRRLYYHPEYYFHTGPWEEKWVDKEGRKHHVKHDGNPNAKGHWFEDWEPGGSKANHVTESFKKNYKSISGI